MVLAEFLRNKQRGGGLADRSLLWSICITRSLPFNDLDLCVCLCLGHSCFQSILRHPRAMAYQPHYGVPCSHDVSHFRGFPLPLGWSPGIINGPPPGPVWPGPSLISSLSALSPPPPHLLQQCSVPHLWSFAHPAVFLPDPLSTPWPGSFHYSLSPLHSHGFSVHGNPSSFPHKHATHWLLFNMP